MTAPAARCAAGPVPRRFLVSVALAGAWAVVGAAFGIPATRACAALCFGCAAILLLTSFAARERLLATHLTHFDEATWFLALGPAALVPP